MSGAISMVLGVDFNCLFCEHAKCHLKWFDIVFHTVGFWDLPINVFTIHMTGEGTYPYPIQVQMSVGEDAV